MALKYTTPGARRPQNGIGDARARQERAKASVRLDADTEAGIRAALGEVPDAVNPSLHNSDFQVELSVGWVDIEAVFPMGLGTIYDGEQAPRKQPRRVFDRTKLDELKSELREHGQLTPAWVRTVYHPGDAKRFNLIDGERRLLMMKELEQTRFLVRVLNADTRAAYRLSVVADIHNVAHSPAERGRAIAQIYEDMGEELREFLVSVSVNPGKVFVPDGLHELRAALPSAPAWIAPALERAAKTGRRPRVNYSDMGLLVGLGERSIRNYLRLGGVDESVLGAIESEGLSGRHATALSSLKSPVAQKKLLRTIKRENLSGEEAHARAVALSPTPRRVATPSALPSLRALVERAKAATLLEAREYEREEGRKLLGELEAALATLRTKWG